MFYVGLIVSAIIGLSLGLLGGGGIWGTNLSHRLAAQRLQKMFAYPVLAVAVFLFAKNYAVLF